MSRGFTFAMTMFALALLAGCNSGGPTIEGGSGLLGPDRVRVGATFDVTQPYDAQSGTEWRLIEYDSLIVYPRDFPRVEAGPDGKLWRKVRFMAKTPGTTELVFARRHLRVVRPGQKPPEPELSRVTVRVVP